MLVKGGRGGENRGGTLCDGIADGLRLYDDLIVEECKATGARMALKCSRESLIDCERALTV